MKSFLVFLLPLLLAAGACVRSTWCDDAPKAEAPDPCVTELTLEKLDNPPERQTNFVRAEEPLQIPLNVKLIDQKFAATIGIEVPTSQGNPFKPEDKAAEQRRGYKTIPVDEAYEEVRALEFIQGYALLAPNVGSGIRSQSERGLAKAMERMLAHIPAERAPDKANREFFASAEIDKYVSTIVSSRPAVGGRRPDRTFVVLGTTAEEAEQRAQILLTILDHGFSRPIQLRMFKVREAQCQQAAEQKRKIAAAELQLKMIGQELQKYADFTPDTLAGVRVQQFQADAELAGLRAKAEAYDKLLAKVDRDDPRFRQLSEAKTAAEVDLVSCEARRATIAAIIAKIKLRGELMEKQTAADTQRKSAAEQLKSIARRIESIDDDIAAFGPVRLTDDRVTIAEVEWVRRPE